jgi:hypothetical protein
LCGSRSLVGPFPDYLKMKLGERDARLLTELAEWCTPEGCAVPKDAGGRLNAIAAALGVAMDASGRILCETPEVRARQCCRAAVLPSCRGAVLRGALWQGLAHTAPSSLLLGSACSPDWSAA